MHERIEDAVRSLYVDDGYIANNPDLHEIDSDWKFLKLIPLLDKFAKQNKDKAEINVLDAGGGCGMILKKVARHLKEKHGFSRVNKYCLDLSPGMLEVQKRNNPDSLKALNEDICATSIKDKEIDLALMLDLLEHVIDPKKALGEIKRISRYAILKVPLEDNLYMNMQNAVSGGKIKEENKNKIGHINIYCLGRLLREIRENAGRITDLYYTNVFEHYLSLPYYRRQMSVKGKIVNILARALFRLSPRLCSLLFNDFAVIMVECY